MKQYLDIHLLGLLSKFWVFSAKPVKYFLLRLQRFLKYLSQNVSTKTMRFQIYPFSNRYALGTAFKNIRFSSFQWDRNAKSDEFISVFDFIRVSGNATWEYAYLIKFSHNY